MKFLLSLILSAFLTLSANDIAREDFKSDFGVRFFIRQAIQTDFKGNFDGQKFDNPALANLFDVRKLQSSDIASRFDRVNRNEAGIFIVERADEEGGFEFQGTVLAGRMPLAVTPAFVNADNNNLICLTKEGTSDEATESRLSDIMALYKVLTECSGGTYNPHNPTADTVVLATTNVHALTVVLGANDFSNLSAQEAIAKLVQKNATKVSAGTGTLAALPAFCLSQTAKKMSMEGVSNTIYCGTFSYYPGEEGLRHVYVTPIAPDFNPKPLLAFLESLKSVSATHS